MKILLIAGHGGTDTGAVAFGRHEADLAREIVPLIRKELQRYGVAVDIYDPKRSAYHDLIALGYDYNFKRYNYVLEVHFNAYRKDPGNGMSTGCEIHVTPSEKTVAAETAILRRIAAFGLKNRGVKRSKLAVILRAKAQGVSSALLEVCFLDDLDDMEIYCKNKARIARAVADGIAEGYRLKKEKGEDLMPVFSDTDGHWAEEVICDLAAQGIVNGYGDGSFKPDENITRAEVAVMLSRVMKKAQ